MLGGGREARSGGEPGQDLGGDLAVHRGVAEVPYRRRLLWVEAKDLEMGVAGADVDRVALGLDGESGILAGADDLRELVGGDERFAVLLDVDLIDGQTHRDLHVGRGQREQPVGGGELDA